MSRKIDVFIIDDDARNLHYYQTIINKANGIRCIGSTSNAEKALDIVITTFPDVVLIDYALYPIDGFTLTQQMREEMPDMPVILLGGRETMREQALEVGANDYLAMPITPQQLIETILRIFKE
jgi:two-component system phosphate regulon response regulator PhoB